MAEPIGSSDGGVAFWDSNLQQWVAVSTTRPMPVVLSNVSTPAVNAVAYLITLASAGTYYPLGAGGSLANITVGDTWRIAVDNGIVTVGFTSSGAGADLLTIYPGMVEFFRVPVGATNVFVRSVSAGTTVTLVRVS